MPALPMQVKSSSALSEPAVPLLPVWPVFSDIGFLHKRQNPKSSRPLESSRSHRSSANTSRPASSFSFAGLTLFHWFRGHGLLGKEQAEYLSKNQLLG